MAQEIILEDSDLFSREELLQFHTMLTEEKEKLIARAKATKDSGSIHMDSNEMMDQVDQASATIEQNLTFKLLDRDRKLLIEIERALDKLKEGDYGYCEGSGEPIPKRRLELRPWTKHSVKYKEQLERLKKRGRGVIDEDK